MSDPWLSQARLATGMWRSGTRTATIESVIKEAILLSRWTASPVCRAMPSLKALRHRLCPVPSARQPGVTGPCEASADTEAPTAAQAMARPRRLRPIIVPASLDDLHGPSSGLVVPPRRLWWSGEEDVKFDLGNRSQATELYEAIFEAARTHQDIADHLDAELLTELWPELGMRRSIRQAWEDAHPALAAAVAPGNAA